MAMLNHGGDEAANAAEYMEDYMDYVENVPHDIQRHVTQYRQLDLEYQEMLQELDQYQNALLRDLDVTSTKRAMLQMQRCLIRAQEIADDKLKTTQAIQDIVENKSRQLEVDLQKLDLGRENEVQNENHKTEVQPERTSKRSRRSRQMDVSLKEDIVHERQEKEIVVPSTSKKQKKKKRKSKVEKEQVTSPVDPPIDPNEPTYCLCDQVSFGEMIGCDNEDCLREWFHFSCVGLTTKPKGKWYCPQCRGDRSNQMKAKFA